jgi:hypothetical protein
MHEYRVVERWSDQVLCALRCSSGRYHLARALHFMPPENAPLHGDKPRLGFGILLCPTSGQIFRIIFESIDDAVPAPQWMHSPPTAATRPEFATAAGGGN